MMNQHLDPLVPLTPIAPNLWEALADGRYWNAFGPWGGWTAGALLAGALAEPEARGAPVAQTAHFMSGFEEGPVRLHTRLLRGGKSLQFWQVDLIQGAAENVVAQSVVTLALRRETVRFREIAPPEAPPPEEIAPADGIGAPPGMGPRFPAMCEIRGVSRARVSAEPDGNTHSISWARHKGRRPLDFVQIAMMADIFAPRIFWKPGPRRPATTISMTIYFHATADEVAAHGDDFLLAEAEGRNFSDGVFDQEARLWRRSGLLIATSEQMCWFR